MKTKVTIIALAKWVIPVLLFLILGGLSNSVIAENHLTLKHMAGLNTKYPQQFELDEFERFTGTKTIFSENSIFRENDKFTNLPPIEKRLPKEPLVVIPENEIGSYGGTMDGIALSYESGTSEIISWRLANFVRFSDDNRTIVPNVAKSWKWSHDYKQITFFLRKGHRWSDGEPFTADDVLFYLDDIILNKDIHSQTPTPWRDFSPKIEKIDDTTVRFTFSKPFTSLLFYLAGSGSYYDPFAPKHFLKKLHLKYNPDADEQAKILGFEDWVHRFRQYWNKWKDAVVNKASGLEVPTLESHVLKDVPNESQRLYVANPYYFKVDTAGNQLPYITFHRERFLPKSQWIDEIISGNVGQKSQSMSLNTYPELKENQSKGDYTIQTLITGLGPVFVFNKTHKNPVKRKIFENPKFNWAISLSIDRKAINDKLFLGLCRPGQALPQNLGFVTPKETQFMTDYDPKQANEYLDEIGLKRGADGFRIGPDGEPFVIEWEYSLQYVWSHEFPLLIKEFFQALGLRVTLKEVSTKEARAKQLANDLDVSNEWTAPFEPTLFANPIIFMPPFGEAYPVMGIPWWEWKKSDGKNGEEPPIWVKNLWQLGEEFVTLVPGSDWYNAVGKKIIDLNLVNLNIIGTLSNVPLITIVSNKLDNVPKWKANSYYFGYAYPYRADQWYFKK